MYDASVSRASPFAHIWPWPGIVFLFLLGAWLFYMGAVAVVPDVKTAFFGLGGTTALLFLFSLRTIGSRPVTRDSATPERGRDGAGDSASETAYEVRERRDVVDADTEYSGTVLDSPAALPTSRRAWERTAAVQPDPDDAPPRDSESEAREQRMMRERAERGAALAKVEGDIRSEIDALRSDLNALRREVADIETQTVPAPDASGTPAALPDATQFLRKDDFNRAVNQRLLPTIEERILHHINEAVARDGVRAALKDADGAFDTNVPQDLGLVRNEIAQARELAEKALRFAAEKPAAVRTEIAGGEPDESVPVLQARVAALEALVRVLLSPGPDEDLSHIEPLELAEHFRSRLDEQQQLTETTASELSVISGRVAELRQETAALADRGAGGFGPETEAEVSELRERVQRVTTRLAKTAKKAEAVDDVQTTLGQVIAEVARIGEQLGAISRRLDEAPAAPSAPTKGAPNEVAELRDALSLIINESRELRARRTRDADGQSGDPA